MESKMFNFEYNKNIVYFSLAIIISFISFGCKMSINSTNQKITQNICDANSPSSGVVITDSNEISKVCVSGINQQPLYWKWAPDGVTLAYALPGDNSPSPWGGQYGNYQPPATKWFIMDIESNKQIRFQIADNKSISFSPNGQYIIIHQFCYRESCTKDVYEVDISTNSTYGICRYKTFSVWMGKSNCPKILLDNGQKWDIKKEYTRNGCLYFKHNNWEMPSQCKTVELD